MGVKFVKDAVTVSIASEGHAGYLRRLEKAQVSGRTSGNVFFVYDKGEQIRRFSVSLMGLSGSEKTALHSFFDTTVNGMELDFTYTDEAGDSWNARFLNPDLTWEKHGKNLWMVKFDLEVWSA